MDKVKFHSRESIVQVEEGTVLAPKFGADGLLPCVTTDGSTGEVLMLGWMSDESLRLTLETKEAHYFSRARKRIWHKGATSGLTQRVIEARIDDDQDAVWLRVEVAGSGASCHVGYRSCFYRAVPMGDQVNKPLVLLETQKLFDPDEVYGDAPNPTQL